jgi:hypothetical protein
VAKTVLYLHHSPWNDRIGIAGWGVASGNRRATGDGGQARRNPVHLHLQTGPNHTLCCCNSGCARRGDPIPVLFAGTDLNVLQYLSVDVTSADESITHRFVEVQGAMDVLFNTYFLFGEDRALPLGLPVIEGFWTHLLLRYSWLGLGFGVLAFYLFTRYSFASTCVLCRGIGLWFVSFFITSAFFSDVLFRFKGPLIYGFLFGYCLYLSQKSTQTEPLEPGAHVFL